MPIDTRQLTQDVEEAPYLANQSPAANSSGNSATVSISLDILDENGDLFQNSIQVLVEGSVAYDGESDTFSSPFDGTSSAITTTTVSGDDGYNIVLDPTSNMSDLVVVQVSASDGYGNSMVDSWSFLITSPTLNFLYYSDGYGTKRIKVKELAGESQGGALTFLSEDLGPALPSNSVSTIRGHVIDDVMFTVVSMLDSYGVMITKNEVNNPLYYMTSSDAYGAQLTDDGVMYAINSTLNRVEVYYGADTRAGESRSPDFWFNTSSTPSITGGTILDLHVVSGQSDIKTGSTRLYIGTTDGMTRIDTYEEESSDGFSAGSDSNGISYKYGISGSGEQYESIGGTVSRVVAVHSDEENGVIFVATDDGSGDGGITQISLSGNQRIFFMTQQGGFLPSNDVRDVYADQV
jgi:hypothetical protein